MVSCTDNLSAGESWCKFIRQEVLLQRDRATRWVNENLVNCRKKLCNKSNGVRLVDCRMGVVNKLHGRQQRRVFTARRYAIARWCYALYLTICQSVRLSATSLSSAETAECRPRITQTTSHDDLGCLVFWGQTLVKFYRDHPQRGRQMLVG